MLLVTLSDSEEFTLIERKERGCWIQKSDRFDIAIKKTRSWT
jgi:hypothetical protein